MLAAAAASPTQADAHIARMAALYDEVCLRAFPDDDAMIALASAKAAREYSPDEVRVTMRDDPARGWLMADGNTTIWLEFPPYHACSVRWSMAVPGAPAPYRAVIEPYMKAKGGFRPLPPQQADQGPIRIQAVGESRPLPDGGAESLYIFLQHIADPQRRAAGETGVSMRFVHQFAPPPPQQRQ
jgi:hypothetical protein